MRFFHSLFWPVREIASFPVVVGIVVLRAVGIAFRRRFPLTVSFVVTATLITIPTNGIHHLFESTGSSAPPFSGDPGWWPTAFGYTAALEQFITVYTVTAIRGRRLGVIMAGWHVVAISPWFLPQVLDIGPLPFMLAFLSLGIAIHLGDVRRRILAVFADIAERSERIDSGRRRAAKEAANAERALVSSELQSLVARNLRRMVNQARSAREAVESDGETSPAHEAITAIERTGRAALADARRALGLLRDEHGQAPRKPRSIGPLAASELPHRSEGTVLRSDSERRHPAVSDVALASAILVTVLSEVGIPEGVPPWFGLHIAAHPSDVAAVLLVSVPLAFRREFPLLVSLLVSGGFAIQAVAGHFFAISALVAMLIGVYSVWAARRPWQGIIGVVGAAAAAPLASEQLAATFQFGLTTVYLPFLPAAAALGWQERRLTAALGERRSQEEELERLAWAEVEQAKTAERLRLARELHDVTAHSLSVMTVQAGAARTVVGTGKEKALRALASVEQTGRNAEAELEHLFKGGLLLRTGEAELRHGIDSIPTLAREMESAGLTVDLDLPPSPPALSPGLDLSIYRVVQEALTNAAKHAGKTRAHVRLRIENEVIDIEIRDEGSRAATTETVPRDATLRGGRGLIGMHERVKAFGGTLTTGRRSERGFSVRLRVPLVVQAIPWG